MTKQSQPSFGVFVTNKWVIGLLVALLMSAGGYVFRGFDRSNDAIAAQIYNLEQRVRSLEIETKSQSVTVDLQYKEIIRRLDRIERGMHIP